MYNTASALSQPQRLNKEYKFSIADAQPYFSQRFESYLVGNEIYFWANMFYHTSNTFLLTEIKVILIFIIINIKLVSK